MPEGFNATSFEFYEGIRILVPGAVAVAVLDGTVRTLSHSGERLGLGTAESLVASLMAGLIYYFVDAPAKSAVIYPLQPTSHIRQWARTPKDGLDPLNLYFVILDHRVPPGIKARALYMGSMFRIGFEGIYTLALGSTVVLAANTWSRSRPTPSASYVPAGAWVLPVVLPLVYAIALRRDVKSERRRAADPNPTDSETRLVSPIDIALNVIAFVWIGKIVLDQRIHAHAYTLTLPIALSTGLWMFRYFKGYSIPGTRRRVPVSAAHGCLLLGLAFVAASSALCLTPRAASRLNATEVQVWIIVAVVTLLLVAARGHEKRLRGAYATQNTWLTLNKETLLDEYFEPETPSSDPPPNSPASQSNRGLPN